MFEFLSKIKKALQNEPEKITLSKSEIKEFIDSYLNNNKGEVTSKIENISEKINAEDDKTRKNLDLLKSAELKNKKIDPKHIQIMEGNRTAYIHKVTKFLDEIVLPKSSEEIEELHAEFNSRIVIFNKHTIKAYYVLQEFFSNESRDVALGIKNIDNLFNEFKKLGESDEVFKINNAVSAYNKVEHSKKRKKELEKEIESGKKEFESLNKSLTDLHKVKENLMKGSEYKVYQESIHKKKELAEKTAELKRKLVAHFLDFDRPLKKFSRVSLNEKLIREYLENPLKALGNDPDLKIMEILNSLKTQIENSKLELKDKQKEKSVAAISRTNRDFFKKIQNEYFEINSELGKANQKMKDFDVTDKILEIKEKAHAKEIIISEQKRRLSEKESELFKINPEALNTKLIQTLNEMSGKIITLTD